MSFIPNIMRMPATRFLLLASMWILLISACNGNKNVNAGPPNDSELEHNKELWKNSGINSYDFVMTKYQGGTWSWAPVLVKVRNGLPVSMEPLQDPGQFLKTDGYEEFQTVAKIFDQIEHGEGNGSRVEVKYNENYGYPEKTIIDSKTHLHSAFMIKVTRFEVVAVSPQ